ncbi:hypothetical protein A3I57_00060 [Candidatus Beckwithbacteria bacterium RIFCSPLOWO2_02_FULL_47_23]|uniref:Methyltransferase domain-containing protein n=2 Tax=Candidatus Beckwithiibacteriota TaxID=1752726 RepID=A0A1F5E1Z1_9BACT|nr:MAG: hypothetical protein A3E73_00615 [Candidatus Beckwithbacteria bacterium RIFCSPHIGHO2_12_FULL_47_17]OGD61310.1 MAG: hypothetical protein A3I57_00060 [Candidatus Beckwithbacteria bacterium RIFCSPLOWO2_02_FULL_47_23]
MNLQSTIKILSAYRRLRWIDRLHVFIRLRRPFFDAAAKFLPDKGRILDFGCGHGLLAQYLSLVSPRLRITGIDISADKIRMAGNSRHSRRIKFIHSADTLKWLKQSGKFDSIIFLNVLYLLSPREQKQYLSAAKGHLRPGGRLIITEQDGSFVWRTRLTRWREWIMVNWLHLTSGATLVFHPHSWWIKILHKYFKKINIVNIDSKGFQKLYLCSV